MLCRQSIIGVFLTLFLFSGTAFAQTTYYIDAENGSDANNGRSEATAWKTISKISATGGFVSGDVISFKRGQTHFGRIVPSTSGLTFNAYGSGNRPVISGAVILNSWTSIGGGVYETSIAAAPKILMINGRKYSKGKYPDNGWMNIDNTSGGNITSGGLSGTNFTGAKAVIRKNRWIIDNDSISSQGGNTIYFSYKFYEPKQNYKFFITDHLACLSQFGEWYYDHAARKLRVFFGTNSPTAVTASISDNVMTIRNVNNTRVSELAFAFANQDIVYMSSTDNTRFSNCSFEYGYNAFGFWAGANTNANISSCTIRFMNNNGCYIAESGNNNGFVLEKNDFHQIGAIPGEGGNGDGTYTAINMGGGYPDYGPSSNARISNNTIDTVGYVGIMGGAQNLLITNNIISQYCFIKDDGGAIYGATIAPNKKISGNIILNGAVKAWEGSDNQNNYAYGLYMDNNSQNVILENNTVANGVVGIFVHDAQNITVQGNTIFNMSDKSIMVWKTGLGQNPVSNIIIRDNIAVNIKQDTRTLDVQNLKQDGTNIANWGSFDLNYYCRPLNETKTIYTGAGSGKLYSLSEWQALYGHDRNSKISPKTFPSNINPDDSIRFVYNPTSAQQATSLNGTYIDARNNQYVSSITLAPYSSAVLFVNSAVTSVPNQSPQANAGNDQIITLPTNSVTLSGSGVDADGTISSYQWRKISGPNGDVIDKAAAVATLITGLIAGIYIYRLTVTDNKGATSFDDVQITVNNAPAPPVVNNLPTVNAGQDIAIALPENSVNLNGSATDADGSIVSFSWAKISGPAGGNIQSANTASTLVTGLNAGTYVFRLTATDNAGAIATDDISVFVNTSLAPSPSNQAPIANAGNDIRITLPTNRVTLNGSGTDADGSVTSYAWSKVSGPSGGNIQTNNAASTNITGLSEGIYIYRLTVTDNAGAQATDDVQVIVTIAPPVAGNQAPTANAGSNQSITLPENNITLSGSGNDTDGSITAFAWTKIAGPAGGNIQSPTAANTVLTGLTEGTYTFRLTVTDNAGATATDDVQVIVNAAPIVPNRSPIANAGHDFSITLPANSVTLNGTASSDPDGNITTYGWRKIQGPAGSSFSSTNIASPAVNGLTRGQYEFELIVTDNRGASSTDRVLVTVIKINQKPVAKLTRDTISVALPVQNAELSAINSYDPDGIVTNYEWTYKKGPKEPKMLSPQSAKTIIADLITGTYEFDLVVTDDDGDKDKKAVVVIVKNSSNRRLIPDVSVYPNPATSLINVKISSEVEGRTSLTFIDMKGRPVMTDVFVKGYGSYTRQVNIGRIPKGTYTILIQIDQTEQVVKKLIKF
jgi:parallel beta-helix repeat protein